MSHRPTDPCRSQSSLLSRLRLAAVAALVALGAVSCAGPGMGDDSKMPADAKPGDVMEIPAGNFMAAWRADLPLNGARVRAVHLNEERVFAQLSDNRTIWLNRDSGHILQISSFANSTDRVYEPVTLADRVVVPSTSQIAVFDRKTGRMMHKIPLRYSCSSAAAGEGRTIFIGEDHPNGGFLAAIDTQPKATLQQDKAVPYELSPTWELRTSGQISAQPAAYQGLVFAGSRDGGVYGVRADNRDVLWPGLEPGYFKTGGEILADLAADKDGVYIASMDSKLYCLDTNTGRVKWTYYAGRPLRETSHPISTANTVYLYVPETGLAAIDKTGKLEIRKAKWIVPDGTQFLSSDEKNAYLRTRDNAILCVDKESGQAKFRSQRMDFTTFATNTSQKETSIYAVSGSGRLYCIRPTLRSGAVGEWVFNTTPIEAAVLAQK